MEEGIDEMILNGDGEVEYWDAVLKRLKVNKSRVRLTDIHRQLWQRALVVQAPKQKQAQEEAAKKRAEVCSPPPLIPFHHLRFSSFP
jgi:hypothetical protein